VKLRTTTTSQCQRRGCPETGTSRTDINFKRTIFLCDTAFFRSKPMNSGLYSESLGSEKTGRAGATNENKGSPETTANSGTVIYASWFSLATAWWQMDRDTCSARDMRATGSRVVSRSRYR
jgi:hypothetical protein